MLVRMEECLRRGDFMGVTQADMDFHRQICLASENEIVIILWETLSRHMLIVFEQELKSDADRAHIVDHHRALRRALESRDPVTLGAEIEKHILRIQGSVATEASQGNLATGGWTASQPTEVA